MKESTRGRALFFAFLLSMAAAAAAVVYGGTALRARGPDLGRGQVESLSDGWYALEGGRRTELSLPATVRGGDAEALVLYRALPESLPGEAVLCAENVHQILEVFLDGEPLYAYGTDSRSPAGQILGDVWNVIALPPDAGGRTVSLRLTAPHSPGEWSVPEVRLGSRGDVMELLYRSSLPTAAFVLLSGALGLMILLLALLFSWKRMDFNRRAFWYLGLFILLCTLWIVTDSKLPQFLTENLSGMYLLSFLSFMLLPAPFLLFVRQFCRHGKALLDGLTALFLLNAAVCAALFFTGTADFVSTLPATHILLGLSIVCVLVLCLWEQLRHRRRDTVFILVGIGVLGLSALAALTVFIIHKQADYSLFFRCGLAGFYILLCYGCFKRAAGLLRTSLQAESYRAMAFTDGLTGLANRAAFDRDVQAAAGARTAKAVTIAVFDINNLKQVNDTRGHAAGDALIRETARGIREAFSGLGDGYRIGGDEFVVLLWEAGEDRADAAFGRLRRLLAQAGEENGVCPDVASGCASGTADGPESVYRLFREADADMYRQKRDRGRASAPSRGE